MSLIGVLTATEQASIEKVIAVFSGPKVDEARNDIFRRWLQKSTAEYLFMTDTDMILPPDVIDRLISYDKDIVGGLCFIADPYLREVKPTIGVLTPHPDGGTYIQLLFDYPQDTLVQCDSTGGACLLIKREVAEKMLQAMGEDHPMPWFAHGMHGDVVIGEDVGFCLKARSLGFEVYVDTGCIVPHVKPQFVGPAEYVLSLSKGTHPHYDERENVPVYQELVNGYVGIGDSESGS